MIFPFMVLQLPFREICPDPVICTETVWLFTGICISPEPMSSSSRYFENKEVELEILSEPITYISDNSFAVTAICIGFPVLL